MTSPRIPTWAKIVAICAAAIAIVAAVAASVSRSSRARMLADIARRWAGSRAREAAEIEVAIARERGDRAQDDLDQALERWRLAREHQQTTAREVVERWGRKR